MQVTQSILQAGTYQYGDRTIDLSVERLAEIASNTQALLNAGRAIPLLNRHAPMLSPEGGPQPAREAAATDTIGWVTGVAVEDGALRMTADVLDEQAAKGYEQGTIRYHSPEMVQRYVDSVSGTQYGPTIRHIAATPDPRAPEQSDILLVADDSDCWVVQLSDADRITQTQQEPPMADPKTVVVETPAEGTAIDAKKMVIDALLEKLGLWKDDEYAVQLTDEQLQKLQDAAALLTNVETAINASAPEDEKPAQFADNTPTEPTEPAEDKPTKEERVFKIAEALDVTVGEDQDVLDPAFMLLLLEKMIAKMAEMEQAAEAKPADQPTQFSDLPADVQELLNQARDSKREGVIQSIKSADIPGGIRDRLLAEDSLQFSDVDGSPEKQYTALEVAEMVEEFVPSLLFDDSSAVAVAEPANEATKAAEAAMLGETRIQQPWDAPYEADLADRSAPLPHVTTTPDPEPVAVEQPAATPTPKTAKTKTAARRKR